LLRGLAAAALEAEGRGVGADARLKHDIVLLGRLDNGRGFYRFAYNGDDRRYVGVMAPEVQTIAPAAVVRGRDGYLRVDHDKLGVKFETYDRWVASARQVSRPSDTTAGSRGNAVHLHQ
jgi:hypothetical protein